MRCLLIFGFIAVASAFEGSASQTKLATVDEHLVNTRFTGSSVLRTAKGHGAMITMLRGAGLTIKQYPDDPDNSDGGGSVLGGMVTGFILWCFIPICLWNNERIAIKQYKMQYKAQKHALHIDDTDKEPIPGPGGMEGRIVYMTGTSKVEGGPTLVDSAFKSVKSDGKVKLRRVVEMYQWVETKHEEKDRDGRVRVRYTYSQSWCNLEQTVSHDNSKRNPPMQLKGTRRQKSGYNAMYDAMAGVGELCPCVPHENFKLGQYYLGEYVIRELLNWKNKEDVTEAMIKSGPLRVGKEATQEDGFWYLSGRLEQAQVGDYRVRFEELVPGPLTLVGVLSKTKTGWTFVPILRADNAKASDGCGAEFGNACCPCLFRVKELHYGLDEEGDEEVKAELPNRPVELKRTEMAELKRSDTTITANFETGDMDDLCCVGCFGQVIVKIMNYLGLEEEFLAVSEENQELSAIMKDESSAAANRHHAARVFGLVGLCCASSCIISPIIALLNYNWLTTLLVGWWVGSIITCCACVTSLFAFLVIVSAAWIAHRPWSAMLGISMALSLLMMSYMFLSSHTVSTTAAPAF